MNYINTTQSIIIRPYQSDDLASIHTLISSAAQTDRTPHITHDALRAISDPEHTTAVVVLPDGTIGGFAWWDAEIRSTMPLEGWVRPDLRRRGIGAALLRAAESITRGLGAERLTARTYSDLPGAMALLPVCGFIEMRRFHQMWTTLDDSSLNAHALPEGFVVRPFRLEDAQEVYEADSEAFSTHWGSQPQPFENWRRHRLIDFNAEFWAIIWDVSAGHIAALCLCGSSSFNYAANDGWVSHLGVRPVYRGRGLGRAALIEGFRRLRRAGFDRAGLHVDSGNSTAIELYESVGMCITRERVHLGKVLHHPA
ncbi:MAG: GNAT family N-acetyltransferase [Aggregatilineales bacterium]